jgi:hypothetical protein
MSYTFEKFLSAFDTNWHEDDPLLHRLLVRLGATGGTPELRRWGAICAGELRELTPPGRGGQHKRLASTA